MRSAAKVDGGRPCARVVYRSDSVLQCANCCKTETRTPRRYQIWRRSGWHRWRIRSRKLHTTKFAPATTVGSCRFRLVLRISMLTRRAFPVTRLRSEASSRCVLRRNAYIRRKWCARRGSSSSTFAVLCWRPRAAHLQSGWGRPSGMLMCLQIGSLPIPAVTRQVSLLWAILYTVAARGVPCMQR